MTPQELIQLRKTLGLTQAQLAKELGVIRTTVSRWEMASGRYPIPEAIVRLLNFLLTKTRR